jgi:hypothetical protein
MIYRGPIFLYKKKDFIQSYYFLYHTYVITLESYFNNHDFYKCKLLTEYLSLIAFYMCMSLSTMKNQNTESTDGN